MAELTELFSHWKKGIFILILLVGCIGVNYWIIQPRENLFHLVSAPEEISQLHTIDKEDLLKRLYQLYHSINKTNNSIENIEQQIMNMIFLVGGRTESQNNDNNDLHSNVSNSSILEVCPEIWLGPKGDYPFYYQGWKQVNCSNVLPFEKVITILLYHPLAKNETCPKRIETVLSGVKKLYPKVQVIVAGISEICKSVKGSLNVHIEKFNGNYSTSEANLQGNDTTPGVIWNKLIKLVTTPYVLVGRDLDDFIWTTNLERQVRMLSYNTSLSVAGGAVRNLTGHWHVGCFQTTMRNYILTYLEGYYASKNECMFCDYLAGPFVTRTKLLQSIKFDEKLPADVLFDDWFWRILKKSHIIVNCPDVMYFASDPVAVSRFENRTLWLPLIRKWELNRLVVPSGRVFSYSCAEAQISCKDASSGTNSFLLPLCCLEQFASAFKALNDMCRRDNVRYELDTGSVLGGLKTSGMMPWDVDADNSFYTSNYSYFKSKVADFKKLNIDLTRFFKKKNDSYFCLYTPDISVEMWGIGGLSHDNATFGEPFRVFPTQVLYHGYWVYAPHSPGSYARSRYGHEVLKHSQHWRQVGLKNSFQFYKPGSFKKCKKPGHHACLDLFSADGNIQFQIPNGKL